MEIIARINYFVGAIVALCVTTFSIGYIIYLGFTYFPYVIAVTIFVYLLACFVMFMMGGHL